MPRCGSCGWEFSSYTLSKHAYTACGEEDIKAPARKYGPEIDDLIKQKEEDEGNE